jgi:hypothetical protein
MTSATYMAALGSKQAESPIYFGCYRLAAASSTRDHITTDNTPGVA